MPGDSLVDECSFHGNCWLRSILKLFDTHLWGNFKKIFNKMLWCISGQECWNMVLQMSVASVEIADWSSQQIIWHKILLFWFCWNLLFHFDFDFYVTVVKCKKGVILFNKLNIYALHSFYCKTYFPHVYRNKNILKFENALHFSFSFFRAV